MMMQHAGTPLRSVVKNHVGTPRSCTKPVSAHKVQQKPKLDRFITNRAAMDLSLASFRLQDKDDAIQIDNLSPSKVRATRSVCTLQRLYHTIPIPQEYQRALAESLLPEAGSRILAYKNKAPAPPEVRPGCRVTVGAHQHPPRALATASQRCTITTRPARPKRSHEPCLQHQSGYWMLPTWWMTLYVLSLCVFGNQCVFTLASQYINVLDWSSSNVVAVALGRGVYLWNANDGTCNQLTELQDEDDYVSRYDCSRHPMCLVNQPTSVLRGLGMASTLQWALQATLCSCGTWHAISRSATCVATLHACRPPPGTAQSCPPAGATAACSTTMCASVSTLCPRSRDMPKRCAPSNGAQQGSWLGALLLSVHTGFHHTCIPPQWRQ